MDTWKFFDITHREHLLCNPISNEKLEELIGLVRLQPDARVLEIATGKGEFIIRMAERYNITGTGVDISPICVEDAKRKHQERVPDAALSFLNMDGADYKPEKPESFDLVACIGASWIYGGHQRTLEALSRMAAAESWIIVGEPYWRKEPDEEYLALIGEERSAFGTHYGNAMAGQVYGLEPVYTFVSSEDDWDKYECLQWYAAEQWASVHLDDPDAEQVLQRIRANKEAYLRFGRDTLGWAIYVYRKGWAKLA